MVGQRTSDDTWTAMTPGQRLPAPAGSRLLAAQARDWALPGCPADRWTTVMAAGPVPLAASLVPLS